MNEAQDLLEQASHLLAELARADVASLTDDALCEVTTVTEQVGRLVDATRVRLAAEVDDRSRYELGREGLSYRNGQRGGADLVEWLTRVSKAEASRRVRLGRALRTRVSLTGEPRPSPFPAVAAAVESGAVGVEAAVSIVEGLAQAGANGAAIEEIQAAEIALVEAASVKSADLVRIEAKVWREYLDPDGATPRDDQLRARRRITLGRELNGMTPIRGDLHPTFAALLRDAFAEADHPGATPRFLSDAELREVELGDVGLGDVGLGDVGLSDVELPAGATTGVDADGNPVLDLADPRTRDQRHYDVLEGLVTAGVRASASPTAWSMRSLATVTAVITLGDLEQGTGVGYLDGVDEPVAATTVQELACDGELQTIILGSSGQVLSLGLRERFFSITQRRALALRDGGCVWPGCDAPPSRCHAHHVVEHSRGGPTDVANGALLCAAHHHMLHSSQYEIRMIRGRPHMLAPPRIDREQRWRLLGKSRILATREVRREMHRRATG